MWDNKINTLFYWAFTDISFWNWNVCIYILFFAWDIQYIIRVIISLNRHFSVGTIFPFCSLFLLFNCRRFSFVEWAKLMIELYLMIKWKYHHWKEKKDIFMDDKLIDCVFCICVRFKFGLFFFFQSWKLFNEFVRRLVSLLFFSFLFITVRPKVSGAAVYLNKNEIIE